MIATAEPLFQGADWDFLTLQRIHDACEGIARSELGLDVYPNHTFQPAAVVRRGDLAQAVQRVLDVAHHPATTLANPTDITPNNLFHYPAARVVGAGLMDLTEGGAFEAWRPVITSCG